MNTTHDIYNHIKNGHSIKFFFFYFFKKEEETEYSGIEVKENSGSRLQNNAFEYISHLTVNSVIVIIMFTLKKTICFISLLPIVKIFIWCCPFH
jgi:hypothetical protein